MDAAKKQKEEQRERTEAQRSWAKITDFTAFSQGAVSGWTPTAGLQNAACAFLPEGKKTIASFPTTGKRCLFCQASRVRTVTGQMKSSAAGLKPSPS